MLCASCGAFEKRLYPDSFETDTSLIRAIYILHTPVDPGSSVGTS